LDEETGLYYYGARYYNPRESIFLSVDTIHFEDDFYDNDENYNGGVYNSFNLNSYAFSYQNPVKYVDPDGNNPIIPAIVRGLASLARWGYRAYRAYRVRKALEKVAPKQKPTQSPKPVEKTKDNQPKTSQERVEKYGEGWSEGSLQTTIDKVAPGAKGKPNDKGTKILYKNEKTGKQVVYDKKGNYYRVEDTNYQGTRKYLYKDGNPLPNNRTLSNGKQRGMTKEEYHRATHFRNIDK
jgi:RHS repeat-associated protein